MGRAAAFLFVLLGLVGSGWGAFKHHTASPTPLMERPFAVVAVAELEDAGDQLYLTYRWADTYDGPDLKNFKDLQVVRADDYGFCLQVVKGGHVFNLTGPGGKAQLGACP
jgi:hypothetical protein